MLQKNSFFKVYRSKLVQAATTLHDMIAAALAFFGAFFLRLGVDAVPLFSTSAFWLKCALFVIIAAVVARAMGLNRGLWRYASVPDLIAIAKTGVLTALIFSLAMFMIDRLVTVPRTVPIITCFLLIFFLGSPRMAYRLMRNRRAQRRGRKIGVIKQSVLLIGSGDGADLFIRAANEREDMRFTVQGVFDERGRREGLKIRGVKILAGSEALLDAIERHNAAGSRITSFVLTKPISELPRDLVDELIDLGAEHGIEMKQLPSFNTPDLVDGVRIEPRAVRIEDLLARPAASLDTKGLDAMLGGARVIVTGAGGSIGSQLCREILAFKPDRMMLLDASEFNLYSIDKEMQDLAIDAGTDVTSLLCDVRQSDRVRTIFSDFKPDIVFHAAALKHVPIVQRQPVEGLHTNVFGGRNVFDAANACGARAMVLVSTDKAINPTSVMGATKRAAELYCQANDLESKTRCVIVRFGNVLGSAGSVVPLFREQIKAGGPVTVTHKDITRYFMTIPEASQLVLQAAQLGLKSETSRGQVHVLDMGEPIKIANLAKKMITLSGFRPGIDIEIVYTGLRPGEKLYEELFGADETLVGSNTKGILIATPPVASKAQLDAFLTAATKAIETDNALEAVRLISDLIPEARIEDIDHLTSTEANRSDADSKVVRLNPDRA